MEPLKKIALMGSFVLVIVLVGLSLVWVRIATVKGTYRYAEREKELRRVEQDVLQQRVRWLQMTSPKNLVKLAKRLELGPPEIDQFSRYERKQTNSKK